MKLYDTWVWTGDCDGQEIRVYRVTTRVPLVSEIRILCRGSGSSKDSGCLASGALEDLEARET